MNKADAKEVDQKQAIILGKNLRHRRQLAGFTLGSAAEGIGVTYQMVQKYENGYNANPSRLWRCAQLYQCDITDLYKGFGSTVEVRPDLKAAINLERLVCRITRALQSIPDPKDQATLMKLIESVADTYGQR